MFDPRVQVLRVLPDHDHTHSFVSALDAGQAFHRPQIRVEILCLAQLNVGTGKALAHGCRERSLQSHVVPCDGIHKLFGYGLSITL